MHAQNTSHRPASDRASAHRHDQRCAPAPHAQNPKHKSSRLSGWELRARLASLARSLEPPSPFFWALHQDCPDRGSNTAPLASQSDYLTHYTTKIARDVTESTKLTQLPCCTKACAREPCYISWYTYIQIPILPHRLTKLRWRTRSASPRRWPSARGWRGRPPQLPWAPGPPGSAAVRRHAGV